MDGVFAKTTIPTDTSLGWYRGRVLTQAEAHAPTYVSEYILELQRCPFWLTTDQYHSQGLTCVDAAPGSGGGTWNWVLPKINATVDPSKTERRIVVQNVVIREDGEFVTTQEVLEGCELFTHYGPTFFPPV